MCSCQSCYVTPRDMDLYLDLGDLRIPFIASGGRPVWRVARLSRRGLYLTHAHYTGRLPELVFRGVN